ncbi:MAG: UDP-N-acetylmuramoyl-tripeptide--D-alanyl-D-alanine ligase [Bacteroidaceae bacterium]|nr:UDP-N-acetylmuramoyl-tripeptide--D-alanyl-D-alanine ligase [Bacteroidaceae bacterium]
MKIETLYDIYCQHPEVTTDSRRVPEGSMFFALKGESFDGNRFAAKALEAGAAAVVVDDAAVVPDGDERYLLVHDVLKALQDLAAYHRQQFRGPVVQVTGTNGKTTTKELIAAVLSERFSVLYTQGNLNNHIGVPLTLLRLRPGAHDIAIIETGANHPGEIAFLARIVDPDYGLITNVGRAHIEGFGSFEGVKRTKGELYDYLHAKPSARIFINESNYDLQDMLVKRDIDIDTDECITYAREQALTMAWVCEGDVLDCNPMLRLWWRPKYDGQHEVQTRLIGAYNIDNVLSAVAIGLHFGVAPEAIDHALATYQPSLGRSEYRRTEHNELIVDAYNANLTSMQAALDNFRRISHPLKMVILGDMKELGTVSDDAHRQIAAQALGSDLQAAWFVGTEFRKAISSLAPAATDIRCFETVEDVKAALSDGDAPAGRLILIKGSNSTKLHQLPDFL